MKIHTTNYTNTFVEIAEDSPAALGEIPPIRGTDRSVANIQFEMIRQNPYKYTSDDVIFHCYATKKDLTESELAEEREKFFSKGQACMRTSPLTKRYGWGVHNNEEGKIAIFGAETEEYKKYSTDKDIQKVKAMRSKRVK